MSHILVINSGSTSLKYSVFTEGLELVREDKVTGIGRAVADHNAAFSIMLDELGKEKIKAVGHRIVHGGGEFSEPIIVDETILNKLEDYSKLAPLHNPAGLAGIKASWQSFGEDKPNIAVFDTAFYKNMPEKAYRYALPPDLADEHKIRRYGFHGISHQSVMEKAAEQLGKEPSEINIITMHLGGGSSITAIEKGIAIDTSMGFTPLEGLIMMTRCGNIDPAIPLFLQKEAGLREDEVYDLLNKQSGMCALAGTKGGMQDIILAAERGNDKARRAVDIYVYQLRKFLGSYFAVLGKVDALVFTGSIGSGSELIRDETIKELSFLKNIPILSLQSGEGQLIARETLNLLNV